MYAQKELKIHEGQEPSCCICKVLLNHIMVLYVYEKKFITSPTLSSNKIPIQFHANVNLSKDIVPLLKIDDSKDDLHIKGQDIYNCHSRENNNDIQILRKIVQFEENPDISGKVIQHIRNFKNLSNIHAEYNDCLKSIEDFAISSDDKEAIDQNEKSIINSFDILTAIQYYGNYVNWLQTAYYDKYLPEKEIMANIKQLESKHEYLLRRLKYEMIPQIYKKYK